VFLWPLVGEDGGAARAVLPVVKPDHDLGLRLVGLAAGQDLQGVLGNAVGGDGHDRRRVTVSGEKQIGSGFSKSKTGCGIARPEPFLLKS